MSKSTLPKINPEIEEDLAAIWFNLDTQYQIIKNQKYRTFRQKYFSLHPTFFMKLHSSYLNFVHFVTKNAIAATAVCLIALTAVSASAAQLVAPTEYKPSTIAANLFGNNKQKETNPYTALKPDENNDVVSFDQCNLGIKYPIKINGVYTNTYKNYTNYSGSINQQGKSYSVKNTDKDYIQYEDVPIFGLESADNIEILQKTKSYFDFLEISCVKNEKALAKIEKAGKNLTKEELFEKTGWFITQADIENISYQTTLNGSSKITFKYQNFYYSINAAIPGWVDTTISEKEVINEVKGWKLFGNQIQLQFNSLVKNQANKEILAKSESVASVSSSGSISSSSSNSNNSSSQNNSQTVTKNLYLAGEADGYILLREDVMSDKAEYYTKTRSEFTKREPTGGNTYQFKITGKIQENPKKFPNYFEGKFEITEIQKIEQTNASLEKIGGISGWYVIQVPYKGSMPGGGMCGSQFGNDLEGSVVYFMSCETTEKFKKIEPKMFDSKVQTQMTVKTQETTDRNFVEIKEAKDIKIISSASSSQATSQTSKVFRRATTWYDDEILQETDTKKYYLLPDVAKYYDEINSKVNKDENGNQYIKITADFEAMEKTYNMDNNVIKVNFKMNNITKFETPSDGLKGRPQTYTNQFYPSLKINYDDSWTMKTDTWTADKKNDKGEFLVNRSVILSKNGTYLSFVFYFSEGFGGGGDNVIQGTKVGENIYRYGPNDFYRYNSNNKSYNYIANSSSVNSRSGPTYQLNSTLKTENGKTADARVTVDIETNDSNLLKEADTIVANSSFGVPIK